ncbi:MAG: curlin [Proteobacteria bacterium SG_bin5]|nr:MAG: curlin [Proteobacteria bacterium SG_bin5]
MKRPILVALAALACSACTTVHGSGRDDIPSISPMATYPRQTPTQRALQALPAPNRPVAIAVYNFTDQTGQFRVGESGQQSLSRAVTQGGASMLVRALQDAGNRRWFTIVERESLRNLLNERQIIREMRERYLGETNVNPQALPAMLFAGVLLEGGIIGFDTNTVTGGLGASLLGIGARAQYRQDTVTVYLRAVSVRTGEVLTTVTASKTIASQSIGGSAFKFIAFRELLEAEAGFTTNEPDTIALQQAIEKAVYALIMEGIDLNLWNFADVGQGWPMLWRYRQERDGAFSAQQVQHAIDEARRAPKMKVTPRDVPPPPAGLIEPPSTSKQPASNGAVPSH